MESMKEHDWAGRRVFVTGHTGFKGSWLVMLLRELGATVFGYSNGVPTNPSLYVSARLDDLVADSTVADIRNLPELERAFSRALPDVVIHMAAQPLVHRSYADPVDTYSTNVQGTAHLLECVRRIGGVAVVVVVTSDKVYAPSSGGAPHVEHDSLGGVDPYSGSKACAELVTRTFRESYFAGGLPVVFTARAGNVIGGGDWAPARLVPDIVRAIADESSLEIRNPRATRPWQHVLDCLSGYLRLVEATSETAELPDAWNFGPDPGQARSVEAVVRSFLGNTGATLDLVSPRDEGPAETEHLTLDSTQARRILGWTPRWGIDESVWHTADWYRRVRSGEDPLAVSRDQISSHGSAR